MGIKSLTTLVGRYNIGQNILLKNCRVVIDCDAMVFDIIRINKLDNFFGGESGYFYNLVKEFIQCLRDNHVDVYMICDGQAKPELKGQTNIARKNRLINFEKSYDHFDLTYSLEHFYIKMVAQVCLELGCHFWLYEYEADRIVALLANHLEAYIISNDSDFFIYNSKPGYVSLNTLKKNNNIYSGVLIKSADVASSLQLDQNRLRLFAILCGNDEVRTYDFFRQGCDILGHGIGCGRLIKTLMFVKCFNEANETANEFKKYILPQYIPDFEKKWKVAMENYNIDADFDGVSSLTTAKSILNRIDYIERSPTISSYMDSKRQNDLITYSMNKAMVDPDFALCVASSGKNFLSVPVQNLNDNSVHNVDEKIRRIIYKLVAIPGKCAKTIIEYDRVSNSYVEKNSINIIPLGENERYDLIKSSLCFMLNNLKLKLNSESFKNLLPNIDLTMPIVAINFINANRTDQYSSVVLRAFLLAILKDILFFPKIKRDTNCISRLNLSPFYLPLLHFIGMYTCVMTSLDTLNELLICPLTPFSPKYWLNGPIAIETFTKMSNFGQNLLKEDDEYFKKELKTISVDLGTFEGLYSACFELIS